jgi:hypothetical protein
MGNTIIVPLFLTSTVDGGVISFTPRLFNPQNGELGGPLGQSGHGGIYKNVLPLSGIEHRPSTPQAVAILSEPSRIPVTFAVASSLSWQMSRDVITAKHVVRLGRGDKCLPNLFRKPEEKVSLGRCVCKGRIILNCTLSVIACVNVNQIHLAPYSDQW